MVILKIELLSAIQNAIYRSIMKSSEIFRKNIGSYLDKMPRGTQSELADKIGIGRQHMNDFVKGRKMLSEEKREKIAEALGYSYPDFLKVDFEKFDTVEGKVGVEFWEAYNYDALKCLDGSHRKEMFDPEVMKAVLTLAALIDNVIHEKGLIPYEDGELDPNNHAMKVYDDIRSQFLTDLYLFLNVCRSYPADSKNGTKKFFDLIRSIRKNSQEAHAS